MNLPLLPAFHVMNKTGYENAESVEGSHQSMAITFTETFMIC